MNNRKQLQTTEVPVTAELLQQKAEQVGNNLNALKVNYPKTAGVLLLGSTIVEGQGWNDPDVLTAKSMAMDYEYHNGGNATNLSKDLFSGSHKGVDVNRVSKGLDGLIAITSQTDPNVLSEQVNKQLGETRFKLISALPMSGEETRYLIEHKKDHYEALEELKAKK